MKTETEKAIETLEIEIYFYEEELEYLDINDQKDEIKRNKTLIVEYKQIITLLQQGEKYKKEYVEREAELYLIIKRTRKYKKMWRELHKVFGNYWNAFDVRKANNRDCDYKYVNELMEEVEQKYFPKI